MKKANVANRILIGLISLLFLLGLVLSSLTGQSPPVSQSVTSSEKEGRRALFLMLAELGFEPEVWRQAPISLPTGEHCVWLARIPIDLESPDEEAETDGEGEDAAGSSSLAILSDPRHPRNYGEFVSAGGTLVLPYSQGNLAWLREDCGLDVPAWEVPGEFDGALSIVFDDGTGMRIHLSAEVSPVEEDGSSSDWDGAEHELHGWHDLATTEEGLPFASWASVDYGRVVFLGSDGFLTNETIGEADNGLFAVRLVEALERGGELYFDEFALGRWLPVSKVELLTAPGVLEVGYHLLWALIVFVLLHTWAREFPRDPREPALNPRLRVSSQARLFERAGRFDLLAHELRLGVLRRIARRAGLVRGGAGLTEETSPEELWDQARRIAESAPGDPALWREAFAPSEIDGARDLEALGDRLHELEKSVATGRPRTNTVAATSQEPATTARENEQS